jgi:hypothetical protein
MTMEKLDLMILMMMGRNSRRKHINIHWPTRSFEKADQIVDYFKDNDPFYDRAAKLE